MQEQNKTQSNQPSKSPQQLTIDTSMSPLKTRSKRVKQSLRSKSVERGVKKARADQASPSIQEQNINVRELSGDDDLAVSAETTHHYNKSFYEEDQSLAASRETATSSIADALRQTHYREQMSRVAEDEEDDLEDSTELADAIVWYKTLDREMEDSAQETIATFCVAVEKMVSEKLSQLYKLQEKDTRSLPKWLK
jgi:hypothetical protein